MTRVLSALLLVALVLGVVWFLPPAGTLALATIAAALGAAEYSALVAAVGIPAPRSLAVALASLACVATGSNAVPFDLLLLAALLVMGVFMVARFRPGSGVPGAAAAVVFPIFYLGVPLGALAAIRLIAGREGVLLLMATIVVSDSAQYYTGRAFGRAPLAPTISPKKTREGAIGGIVLGTAAMVIGSRFIFPEQTLLPLVVAGLVVVALGIAGDLFESLLKRSAGVKDSGRLIPGHGGILDRIDSWLFAGPAYYIYLRYLVS